MHLDDLLGPDVLEILREDPSAVRDALNSMHPADVAEVVSVLPREDRLRVLGQLDAAHLGDTLVFADGETMKIALNRFAPESLTAALDHLEADDVASILSAIPEEKRVPILGKMKAGGAAAADRLLRYEPGTAGRLMTTKFVRVQPEQNVGEVLQALRSIDPQVATVANLYVVDASDRLQGVVSLRRLLPANPDVRVDSMMVREVVAAKPDTPQDEAARIVSKYSFNALPIVDEEHRILGIVTVDDVVDVLVAGETESMLRMGGELAKVVALSFFIPLIIGTGGNAGSQTVSTIIRALALGQIRLRDGWRVLLRETSSGFLLGALLCVFAVLRTLLWKSGPQLALVVGLTTLVDATGLAIYLLIAKVILHL